MSTFTACRAPQPSGVRRFVVRAEVETIVRVVRTLPRGSLSQHYSITQKVADIREAPPRPAMPGRIEVMAWCCQPGKPRGKAKGFIRK